MAEKAKEKFRADFVLLAAVIVIGAFVGLFVFLTARQGSIVQVRVSGQIAANYPLNHDLECDIVGKDNGINHLVIHDGEAYVAHASCPDGLCVNMGKIHVVGQSVICLPNQVVVEIVDQENEDGRPKIDSIVGK